MTDCTCNWIDYPEGLMCGSTKVTTEEGTKVMSDDVHETDPPLDWRPLAASTTDIPEQAVARREASVGEAAAADLVRSDPDSLWIDGAEGQRVLTDAELARVEQMLRATWNEHVEGAAADVADGHTATGRADEKR